MKWIGRLFLLIAISPGVVHAAPPGSPRPRVGLVLEGGGALGCAHVGVLKVLEQERIPIDLIAGTSMGAIVGGLYAAGLSPQEIEAALVDADWDDIFSDNPPRRQISYRRKQDDGRYIRDLQVGLKRGHLILPTGLIAGQKLGFLLQSLTIGAADITDFDSLGVPFRAVATDIVKGETVVLRGGNLADAMRASMSVPGVFTPVEIDERLLVDGGLTANLPVDVARGMGAEFAIAVDIGTPLSDRKAIRSAIGVSRQVVGLLTRSNVERQLPAADLIVRPDLRGFGGLSFRYAAEMVRRGEEAARILCDSLRALSVGEAEYEAYLKRIRRPQTSEILVGFVRIESRSRVDPRRLEGRLGILPGRPLDLALLRRDLTRVYDIGEFERVEYRVVKEDERTGIVIRAKDKYWGPDYVRFGLCLRNDLAGRSFFDLLASYSRTCLNARGAEWKLDLQTGRTHRAFTELYQPLGFRERLFAAPSIEAKSVIRDLYEGSRRMAERRTVSLLGGVDLGARIGTIGEARIGGRWGRSTAHVGAGAGDFPDFHARHGDLVVRCAIEQVDDASFPRGGGRGSVDLRLARESLGAENDYDRLSASASFHQSFGRNTLSLGGSGGTCLGSRLPPHDDFTLGGLFSLSGYREGELSGRYSGVARAGLQRRGGRLLPFAGGYIHFAAWAEAGNTWALEREIRLDRLRFAGTLALGADTILGPFYLAHGRAEGGRGRFYLLLGRGL